MSKTTLAGILGAFLAIAGPWASARLQGDKTAPPFTAQNVTTALTVAALGKLAQDQNKPQ